MKTVNELSDLEANRRLTELLDYCPGVHPFATSYNAIIPVMQNISKKKPHGLYLYMENYWSGFLDDTNIRIQFSWVNFMNKTPRELLNAAIDTLEWSKDIERTGKKIMSDKCIGERWWADYNDYSTIDSIEDHRCYNHGVPVIVIRQDDLEKKATEWEEDAVIDRENGDFKWAAGKMAIVSELRSLIPPTKESEVVE